MELGVPMHRVDIRNDTHNQADPVATLLIRIRDLHDAAQKAGCNALHHALDAGDALLQVQKQVTDSWKKWLATNCSVPVRTAELYMQLARHRNEIETHLEDLSIRGALRLITKPKSKSSKPITEVSLQSLWAKASDRDKTAFCDAVGVAGFRQIWSLQFHRTLLDGVRLDKIEGMPNCKMTTALWTALSLLASIDDPTSSEIVRKANTNQLLTALRALNKTIRAAGNKEVALSLVDADTIESLRNLKKKHAA